MVGTWGNLMTPSTPPSQQEYEFGYFPRNKYKDLVFYIKTGEHSNTELFEMPDTPEHRAIMEALKTRPHTSTPALPDEICRICEDCRAKHDTAISNATLDDLYLNYKKRYVEDAIDEIRRSRRSPQKPQ
jgi:hypothetical protein